MLLLSQETLEYAAAYRKEFRRLANVRGWLPRRIPYPADRKWVRRALLIGMISKGYPSWGLWHGIRNTLHALERGLRFAAVVFVVTLIFRMAMHFVRVHKLACRILNTRKKLNKAVVVAENAYTASGGKMRIAEGVLKNRLRELRVEYIGSERLPDGTWMLKGVHIVEPDFGPFVNLDVGVRVGAVFGGILVDVDEV